MTGPDGTEGGARSGQRHRAATGPADAPAGSHCTFDIQVANAYGETLEFWGVDLCSVSSVYVE